LPINKGVIEHSERPELTAIKGIKFLLILGPIWGIVSISAAMSGIIPPDVIPTGAYDYLTIIDFIFLGLASVLMILSGILLAFGKATSLYILIGVVAVDLIYAIYLLALHPNAAEIPAQMAVQGVFVAGILVVCIYFIRAETIAGRLS
jgi:hypothetical protein